MIGAALLLVVLSGSPVQKLSGTVQVTEACCGGAYSPERIADARGPKPAQKRLLIRRGERNSTSTPVAEVISDAQGRFEVDLPPGTYCLVEAEKRAPPPKRKKGSTNTGHLVTDWDCLREAFKQCDATATLTETAPAELQLQFHRACFGAGRCVQWTGPLPPSAAPRR
jgi:hypothetical protein